MGHVRPEVKRANEFLMATWKPEQEIALQVSQIINLGYEPVEVAVTPPVYQMLKQSFAATHNIADADLIDLKKFDNIPLRVLDPEYFNVSGMSGFGIPLRVNMRIKPDMLTDEFYDRISATQFAGVDVAKVNKLQANYTKALNQSNTGSDE